MSLPLPPGPAGPRRLTPTDRLGTIRQPGHRVSHRVALRFWVGVVTLLLASAVRWADGGDGPGWGSHDDMQPDIALPDSVAAYFAPSPTVRPAPPAATAPDARTTAVPAPSAPAVPSIYAARAARFQEDVRAMAFDVYGTGWVGVNRAKYLGYLITSEAYRQGVPPALIFGVILVEDDRWLSRARSDVGATGLMQIMPRLWLPVLGAKYGYDLTDDATNIRFGVHILSENVRAAGVEKGLLRYNGCVRGTHTPDCFLYPYKVRRRVEHYAPRSCPSRDFRECVEVWDPDRRITALDR